MGNVVLDGSREKDRFLRHETDLAAKPLDIELLEIDAVQSNDARQRIVKPLDQGDDGRLPRSGSTDQGDVGSGLDGERKILDNWNIGARRIVELDILEDNAAITAFGLQSSRVSGVDGGDTVNRSEKLGRSSASVRDSLKFWCHQYQRESTDENGNDDVDDLPGCG